MLKLGIISQNYDILSQNNWKTDLITNNLDELNFWFISTFVLILTFNPNGFLLGPPTILNCLKTYLTFFKISLIPFLLVCKLIIHLIWWWQVSEVRYRTRHITEHYPHSVLRSVFFPFISVRSDRAQTNTVKDSISKISGVQCQSRQHTLTLYKHDHGNVYIDCISHTK